MESRIREVFRDSRVRMECGANVRMKGFEVHDCGSSEYQRIQREDVSCLVVNTGLQL